MKKFFNNNMMYFMIGALVLAIASLVLAVRNSQKVKLLPEKDSAWYKTLEAIKEQAGTEPAPEPMPKAEEETGDEE